MPLRDVCRDLRYGPTADQSAVADKSGRVHGIERVSVAAASIVPNGPSGFTHIPTIMFAARLPDQIASRL
jgi:choline dehydrogenase-like flavoprotein